ncbi:MAG: hypothetical protein BAJALOKI2v1_50096 [Promethearchaeota archaeon]|nr:MAG: hypothetical protein BAJALOKI2v1_50096 [Candidatus Lokiarchaeota archaeon]
MKKEVEENLDQLEKDVEDLINKQIDENSALMAISIGTHGGTHIASKFKKGMKLRESEITAATSSLLFLSSKMLKDSLNQEISYNLIAGREKIILSILTESITCITYLNRELAELEGLNEYVKSLKKFSMKISAIVETSELIKEEIFVAVKRAIPNALVVAIISKEGLPIKIQATMAEPMISAMISALYSLSDVLLEGGLEYSVIAGENGSIIVHELDANRILCVAVPSSEDDKLGTYIARIKAILE